MPVFTVPAADPAPPQPFAIAVRHEGDEVVVVPSGELDFGSADRLDAEVRELRRTGCAHVVLDLRGLAFMDSTGLRVLLSIRNDAKRDGFGLTLVPGPPVIQRVFELTATRGLFDWR